MLNPRLIGYLYVACPVVFASFVSLAIYADLAITIWGKILLTLFTTVPVLIHYFLCFGLISMSSEFQNEQKIEFKRTVLVAYLPILLASIYNSFGQVFRIRVMESNGLLVFFIALLFTFLIFAVRLKLKGLSSLGMAILYGILVLVFGIFTVIASIPIIDSVYLRFL